MAEVSEFEKICPYCKTEYEHRTKLPDICLGCGEVLNKEPIGRTFAVAEYLHFQLQDKRDDVQQNVKGLPSVDGGKALTDQEAQEKFMDTLEIELSLFTRTCTKETVMSAVMDSLYFIRNAFHSTTLSRKDLEALSKIAQDIGELGKHLEFHAKKGVIPYELRSQNVNASELGLGTRSPIDIEKTEH